LVANWQPWPACTSIGTTHFTLKHGR
jgi:hypothetical protein